MKKALQLIACGAFLSTPAMADPMLGFGLNLTFGSGGVDYGVGARVFSNNERDKPVASLGLDYMFGSESWRGSLGAAYMMDDGYIELNSGYNFGNGGFDFGFGAGGAKTLSPATDSLFDGCDGAGGGGCL